jgi:sigma-B regulation protein RsbU (phosphoserine phosphatase)
MPELIVETGPLAGTSFSFGGPVVIGRGVVAEVRLDDVTVSRRHAEIKPQNDGWYLMDLGSANGIFINKTKVTEPTLLKDKDFVEVGLNGLRFSSKLSIEINPANLTSVPTENVGALLLQELLARVRLCAQLSDLTSERLSRDELALKSLDIILDAFERTDRAAVFLVDFTGQGIHLLCCRARDPNSSALAGVEILVREALHHPKGLLLLDNAERSDLTERLQLDHLSGSRAVIPIRFSGEVLGALYLDAIKNPAALKITDREQLVTASNIFAGLLAPLCEPMQDFLTERHDMALARRMQQRFLPQSVPSISGYLMVDDYTAARAIGGDYYDFLELPDKRLAIVIADVSGKGVSGALCMARLGAVLRQLVSRISATHNLLNELNKQLCQELDKSMFVTLCVLALEPATGHIEIASAGHPPPLVRRRNGSVVELVLKSGLALGVDSTALYVAQHHVLEQGEMLLFYTDGLDEAQDQQSKMFGLDKVRQTLSVTPQADLVVRALRTQLIQFMGSQPMSDDLTMIALQRF